MKPVVGIGAGGHAKVVIEILRLTGGVDLVGLLDVSPERLHDRVLGVPVLGDDGLLPALHARGVRAVFIGVGGAGDTRRRRDLYDLAVRHGFEVVAAVHPHAVIAPSAAFGRGPTIMAGAVVNASAAIGDNVIVNTGAIVEHDCIVANHVHLATGARLAGGARIGEGAHVGLGAVVRQGIHVGRHALVGAGAVVVDDVPDEVVVVGVPARVLRRVEEAWPT